MRCRRSLTGPARARLSRARDRGEQDERVADRRDDEHRERDVGRLEDDEEDDEQQPVDAVDEVCRSGSRVERRPRSRRARRARGARACSGTSVASITLGRSSPGRGAESIRARRAQSRARATGIGEEEQPTRAIAWSPLRRQCSRTSTRREDEERRHRRRRAGVVQPVEGRPHRRGRRRRRASSAATPSASRTSTTTLPSSDPASEEAREDEPADPRHHRRRRPATRRRGAVEALGEAEQAASSARPRLERDEAVDRAPATQTRERDEAGEQSGRGDQERVHAGLSRLRVAARGRGGGPSRCSASMSTTYAFGLTPRRDRPGARAERPARRRPPSRSARSRDEGAAQDAPAGTAARPARASGSRSRRGPGEGPGPPSSAGRATGTAFVSRGPASASVAATVAMHAPAISSIRFQSPTSSIQSQDSATAPQDRGHVHERSTLPTARTLPGPPGGTRS